MISQRTTPSYVWSAKLHIASEITRSSYVFIAADAVDNFCEN